MAKIEKVIEEELLKPYTESPLQESTRSSTRDCRFIFKQKVQNYVLIIKPADRVIKAIRNGVDLMSPEGKSWIQSRTGQANALAEFSSFEPPWQYHHPIRPTSQIPTIPLQMPKQTVVLNALQQYKQNVLSLAFPVVEVSAFEKTIAEAYNFEGPGNSIQLCSQACVLAFLALTSLMVPQTSDFMESLLASESYSTSARILLPLMLKEASIEKLQTLVMLVSYLFPIQDFIAF